VVTGAARGIGRAISENLANSGANLAIIDLLNDPLQETKAICEKYGVTVKAYPCDVTDVERVKTVLKDIEQDLGPIELVYTSTTPHKLPIYADMVASQNPGEQCRSVTRQTAVDGEF
jgi:NAD(P)-dependent dehydrogenase (short-subunit alcohol dehydrogenase family)